MEDYIMALALYDVFPTEWDTYVHFKEHTHRILQMRKSRWFWFRIIDLHDAYYGPYSKKEVLDSKQFFEYLLFHIRERYNNEIFVSRTSKRKNMRVDAIKVIDTTPVNN